jgi:alkylation response protein AidB-like acyl-CoA dehydrogenase
MTIANPIELEDRLAAACTAVVALDPGDAFDPSVPAAIVASGLHLAAVPTSLGGGGAGFTQTFRILTALGAIDGATALGFAMHLHVTGAAAQSDGWPPVLRERLFRAVVDEGALVNAASTEEGGGSPSRGAIPGMRATPADANGGATAGQWRLTGEKTWTTWLPALRFALVSARVDGPSDPPEVANFLVDLESPGVERRAGFDAMGMRGSASGRLRLTDVVVPAEALLLRRGLKEKDPRGPVPGAWFAICIASVYLGVGEGAREAVARWALDRRPGDGATAVADLPTIQLRLGRLDAALRSARIVVEDVARRWDAATDPASRRALEADLTLIKIAATNAAVLATDEALRIAGGPGFLSGRLERAFRDARAGLINPPLDDVALTGFGRSVLARHR